MAPRWVLRLTMKYHELHASSAFSFLRGASNPEALLARCGDLDIPSIALCDRDGVYGAPRLFVAARELGVKPIVGCELTMEDDTILPLLVETAEGYRNLCQLITHTKLRGSKHRSFAEWKDLGPYASGLIALTGDNAGPLVTALRNDPRSARAVLDRLVSIFGKSNVFVELQRHYLRGERTTDKALRGIARDVGLPVLATNGVCYATPHGRAVLDVFTCARHHTNLDHAGRLLAPNAERHLKSAAEMMQLFADAPEAIANTELVANRIAFSLENLGYEFPQYPVPPGQTMDGYLREVTFMGAHKRFRHIPKAFRNQLEKELAIIAKLQFSGYFLIVWDIVNFCNHEDIMVQGRGSAANSAVCFSLGITGFDPIANNLLFERFLSEGRTSWPDIDLDLPSGEKRERVIQEVYRRYGRNGAAMTANVITYRGRSAMREIGKALGLSQDVTDRFSSLFASGDFPHTLDLQAQLEQAGVPGSHPRAAACVALYKQMYGLPRHLGQHSGGIIICQNRLDSIMPLERASMPGRVVAQWDKEDCENLQIIKVDLLGLGMLSVMQDTLRLARERKQPVELSAIPLNDSATFALLQKADTIGVFQVESRAQMATLPRLKPREFYDVVIEVAIIRPGPIQGHLTHPYLARRSGREPVVYYDEKLAPVLERTLGVPLFQEQMLKIAMVMADFSGAEAEELRRALSFHRSQERMERVKRKLRDAMEQRGIKPEVIAHITDAISSFALYGFPESHALSFGYLAYCSAYLKVHRTAEFFASLLNNQPMGFYSSATLVMDARRHGLRVLPVSVTESEWHCTVLSNHTIRLGFCVVKGLASASGSRILTARAEMPFSSVADFKRRASCTQPEMRTLASIGALQSLAKHRRAALWRVEERAEIDLFASSTNRCAEPAPLSPMTLPERVQSDYRGMDLSPGPHPMRLLRQSLPDVWRAADLPQARNGDYVAIGGTVICRQRPGTAKGFVFISLEDETGVSNAIIAPDLFEKLRLLITQEQFLLIRGRLQNSENVIHIRAEEITPLPHATFPSLQSHDFR
jgi:error-prone DNA polymerase